jgi:hypothetical protein
LGKLTFEQVLAAIERQILVGKTCLAVAKGLLAAEWAVFGVAPTFFGLMSDGSLELAQMAIAKLYDRGEKAVTVKAMLLLAAGQPDAFQKGDLGQVNAAILKSAQRVIGLQPIIDAIRKRRDKWLAHLDPSTVRSPAALTESVKLTIEDLERIFKETEDILSALERLFDGTIGEIRYLGGDDYRALLDHVRRATSAEKKELDAALRRGTD